MTRFDRVLSKQELSYIFESMGYAGGHGTFLDIANEVQQTVLAKLAEQEPIAWIFEDELPSNYPYEEMFKYSKVDVVRVFPVYAPTPTPCVSPTSDKTACVSKNAESELQHYLEYIKRYQKWRRGEDKTMDEAGIHPKEVGESLDWLITFAENHIADMRKMVWCACGDGFEADTFGAGFIAARGHCQGCDAEDRSSLLAESKAKIMAAADWLADVCVMEIRGTETDKDVAEAYKALEMRVAAELAIAQERANKEPEGWQLVRVDPSEAQCLLIAKECGFEARHSSRVWAELLAAAPKYKD